MNGSIFSHTAWYFFIHYQTQSVKENGLRMPWRTESTEWLVRPKHIPDVPLKNTFCFHLSNCSTIQLRRPTTICDSVYVLDVVIYHSFFLSWWGFCIQYTIILGFNCMLTKCFLGFLHFHHNHCRFKF